MVKGLVVPVITIDGASGTGKGTVAHHIAKQLGWNLLDSGALYRAVALAAEKYHIALDDELALTRLAQHLHLQFVASEISAPPRILFEGQDVTEAIRSETVGNAASKVAILPGVREALMVRQRVFRQPPGLVTDGRDMGTVIFPDAAVKIFLRATAEVRATRRYNQLSEIGIHVNLGSLVEELHERDKRDSERRVAPLKPAVGAVCIDTDYLTINEVVDRIILAAKKAAAID